MNPGAIVATSLAPGRGEEKWTAILGKLSACAGRPLELDTGMLASAAATNHVNRAAVYLLHSRGALGCDPDLALDLYTRQSCLQVTARDLATRGDPGRRRQCPRTAGDPPPGPQPRPRPAPVA